MRSELVTCGKEGSVIPSLGAPFHLYALSLRSHKRGSQTPCSVGGALRSLQPIILLSAPHLIPHRLLEKLKIIIAENSAVELVGEHQRAWPRAHNCQQRPPTLVRGLTSVSEEALKHIRAVALLRTVPSSVEWLCLPWHRRHGASRLCC